MLRLRTLAATLALGALGLGAAPALAKPPARVAPRAPASPATIKTDVIVVYGRVQQPLALVLARTVRPHGLERLEQSFVGKIAEAVRRAPF
jgi:hypothetical protein